MSCGILFLQLLQVVEQVLIGAGLTLLMVTTLSYLHAAGMKGPAHSDGRLTRDLMSFATAAFLLSAMCFALSHHFRDRQPDQNAPRRLNCAGTS